MSLIRTHCVSFSCFSWQRLQLALTVLAPMANDEFCLEASWSFIYITVITTLALPWAHNWSIFHFVSLSIRATSLMNDVEKLMWKFWISTIIDFSQEDLSFFFIIIIFLTFVFFIFICFFFSFIRLETSNIISLFKLSWITYSNITCCGSQSYIEVSSQVPRSFFLRE